MTRVWAAAAGLCLLAPAGVSAQEPRRIRADVPWALHPGDDLGRTPLERRFGLEEEALSSGEPVWNGDAVYTPDGGGRGMLEQQGVSPQHAVAYEPSPGVLYVAMNGMTLTGPCGAGGESANAAKRCSVLVDGEVEIPGYGGSGQQEALFDQLAAYYEPFDVVLTTSQPPAWMPYTMAVIGGEPELLGLPGGFCGVANVQCDGLRRNHVSFTFSANCGTPAETAAHETAHSWGLEHTDNTEDLLFPTAGGEVLGFVDTCTDINHDTGKGVTECGYVHESYCPDGNGEQQNSYLELMGVFGPRTPDDQAPRIFDVFPEDGSVFTTEDAFTITARIEENSNFVGVSWTLEGGDTTLSRCTNNVCDEDYNAGVGFDPSEVNWDFTTVTNAPAGDYVLTLEVLDAYGGYARETISVTVVDVDGGSSGTSSGGGDGTTGDGDETGGPIGTTGSDVVGTDTEDPGARGGGGGGGGCTCSQGSGGPHGFLALLLLGLTLRRRGPAA